MVLLFLACLKLVSLFRKISSVQRALLISCTWRSTIYHIESLKLSLIIFCRLTARYLRFCPRKIIHSLEQNAAPLNNSFSLTFWQKEASVIFKLSLFQIQRNVPENNRLDRTILTEFLILEYCTLVRLFFKANASVTSLAVIEMTRDKCSCQTSSFD